MKPDVNIVGRKVEFTNETEHRLCPAFYPEVGTVGVVKEAPYNRDLLVDWGVGNVLMTADEDYAWYCPWRSVELVEEDV